MAIMARKAKVKVFFLSFLFFAKLEVSQMIGSRNMHGTD